MPLQTNNSRPAIPYQPEQILPNYNRYENLGQFPPTAQQLDGDMNRIIDLLNTQSAEINGIVVGALPGANDPLNANFLLTTDGNGNISWTPINQVNLGVASVGTNNIIDAAVTSAKIQPQAIQTNQLANNAVTSGKIAPKAVTNAEIGDKAVSTNKLADGAVTTGKIQDKAITGAKVDDLTLPYTALQSAGSVSMLASRTDFNNGRIYAMTMTDWCVPVTRPNEPYVSSVALNEVFNNSANNVFNGAKLQNATIDGSKLIDSSVNGSKIVNGTVPGSKLTDASVSTAKLIGTAQFIPFAMGYYVAGGGLQKGIGVQSVAPISTGMYQVTFSTEANDANYIVLLGADNPNSPGGIYSAEVYSRATTGFVIRTGFNNTAVASSFNFLVYNF